MIAAATWNCLVFSAAASLVSCIPKPCTLPTLPGMRSGYEIVWTANEDFDKYARICIRRDPHAYVSPLRFEIALIRGTGDVHVGSKLWSELAPRLAEFKLDDWNLACGGGVYAIMLNAKQESCHVDRIIEIIGRYLRERNASDFVVLQMGVWAAPAA